MTKDQFLNLLQKYLDGAANPTQEALLNSYYSLFMADPEVLGLLNTEERAKLGAQMKGSIDRAINPVKTTEILWKTIIAVAAAVAAIVFGIWFFNDQYHDGDRFISVGKGEINHITLADGTKVWLNAGSRLDFPSHFEGNTRMVKLVGEGYFEVSKDAAHPFIVHSPRQQIKVVGTRFNIIDYGKQAPAITSLVEGSIEILPTTNPAGDKVKLSAGQQYILNKSIGKLLKFNRQAALAWKDGEFCFENESLESVMERAAYWYDVEIIYLNDQPKTRIFAGRISREVSLSHFLSVMSATGLVKFRVEDRKVYVE